MKEHALYNPVSVYMCIEAWKNTTSAFNAG